MDNVKQIYKPLVLMMLACIMSVPGRGQQVTGDQYEVKTVQPVTTSEVTEAKVVDSSGDNGENIYRNASDGNLGSYWESGKTEDGSNLLDRENDRVYLTFDLGGRNKNVKYIEIIASYADRLPREIEIGQSTSEDGRYTNVSTYTNSEIESRIVI